MALKNEMETSYGVNVHYWKVSNMQIDFNRHIVIITLGGYVDENARKNGSTPLEMRKVNVSPLDYEKYFCSATVSDEDVNHLKQCYVYLKEKHPEFCEATNI
ncbi:hypothetical protein F400_gp078 [Bacillus phage BCD7]|uniref:Uncharacterized protein n=1 Tax=Bacillus phage BCD7 TaxID=1136534 RepID=J9PVB7_9CAUD|nr:hypothetical protein F400_gp078 [Bacillus phage BCD7]AEZ50525.1 hypothetical protein BCD7_0078 [Bacillus phage BCD7]